VTVVLVATEAAHDLARAVGAVGDHAPDGTRVVVVANGATDAIETVAAALDAADPGAPGVITDLVRTSTRLGYAAALNAGIRRATAPLVLLLDPSVELVGDLVSAVAEALEDPTVAVAGPFGLVSDDLRSFRAAPAAALDTDAVEGVAIAFRRADYALRGPLDEHFTEQASLDTWWSLVLRDQADDADEDVAPRRALQVGTGLVVRHPRPEPVDAPQPERDRQLRRNRYRFLKRFASRRDLLVAERGEGPR
jgi:GT2 family glycosyltransferase